MANTGNAQNQTGVVDGFGGEGFFFDCDAFDFDGFCDRDNDFLFFFDDNRFFGDNDGDFEFDDVGSSIEMSPTNTTSSDQEVNQAASASG